MGTALMGSGEPQTQTGSDLQEKSESVGPPTLHWGIPRVCWGHGVGFKSSRGVLFRIWLAV